MEDLGDGEDADVGEEDAEEHLAEDEAEDGGFQPGALCQSSAVVEKANAIKKDDPGEAAVDEIDPACLEFVNPFSTRMAGVGSGKFVGEFANLGSHDAFDDDEGEECAGGDSQLAIGLAFPRELPWSLSPSPSDVNEHA